MRYQTTAFDEIVVVLEGRVSILPDGGSAEAFNKGDTFILPKDFAGTLTFSHGYRELTVMETQVMRRLAEAWNVSV